MKVVSRALPFLLASHLPGLAFAAKIEHAKIVEPKIALATAAGVEFLILD